MIDLPTATAIVESHLREPENRVIGDEWVICNDKTVHGEFGWMFFYTTKRFRETGNWRYEAPGNVPLLVDSDGRLHLAGSGAPVESSIYAFVKDRKDFPIRSLAPLNHFIVAARCPGCRSDAEIAFAAKIGFLDHHQFRIGEEAYPRFPAAAPVAPAPNLENRDFISYGLGICPACRRALWTEIHIHEGRFNSLRIVPQPSDPETWAQGKEKGTKRKGDIVN